MLSHNIRISNMLGKCLIIITLIYVIIYIIQGIGKISQKAVINNESGTRCIIQKMLKIASTAATSNT